MLDKFILDRESGIKIVRWMLDKKYSNRTVEKYTQTLKLISKKYKHIDRHNVLKIISKFKNQNQRAALCLINRYCLESGIDFFVQIPKMKRVPRKNPEILSMDEIKKIISVAPKPYDMAIRCIFNMGAGLRVSEMLRLSWIHIKWAEWLKDKDNYGIAIIKQSKGGKDRVVNIPGKLMQDLFDYAKSKKILNEFNIPDGGVIFPFGINNFRPNLMKENLDKWKYEYLKHAYNKFRYNIIQKYCEPAINKKIKIHSLRHSRATYLYEVEKVPIERIQMLLGHSDIQTTMIYTKINPISTFDLIENKEI